MRFVHMGLGALVNIICYLARGTSQIVADYKIRLNLASQVYMESRC